MFSLKNIFGKKQNSDIQRDAYLNVHHAMKDVVRLHEQMFIQNEHLNPDKDYSIGCMTDCYCPYGHGVPIYMYRPIMKHLLKQYDKMLEKQLKNPRKIVHHYEWDEFLDYVDWHGREKMRASQSTDWEMKEFSATQSFEEAMHLARYGWDGLGDMLARANIKPAFRYNPIEDFNMRMNVAGGAINIGRYLTGMPDCMYSANTQSQFLRPQKEQKILFSFDADARHAATQLAEAGLEVYQIAETLEMANIHTEIVWHTRSCQLIRHRDICDIGGVYDVYVTLKKAYEPLQFNRHMFAMAHPSFLRRLVFSEMERNNADVVSQFGFKEHFGYGVSERFLPTELAAMPDVLYIVASDLLNHKQSDNRDAIYRKINDILNSRGR